MPLTPLRQTMITLPPESCSTHATILTGAIPLAGVAVLDRKTEPWEAELRAVAQRLDPNDRNMWLAGCHDWAASGLVPVDTAA
jgi:hypothetical protein